MDIEKIKKFVQDENAWYHIQMPSGTSQDELMDAKCVG